MMTREGTRGSTQPQTTRRGFLWLCAAAWLASLRQSSLLAQAAPSALDPHQVHTLYVAPLAPGDPGESVRRQLLHDLQHEQAHNPQLRLVTQAAGADSILTLHTVFWRSGQVSVNPRAPGSTYSTFAGYASAELVDRARQPLWSFLATPSRFSFAGLAGDLAAQLSSSLIAALNHGLSAATLPAVQTNPTLALRAAGATFPAPLYHKWFESFAAEPGGFPIAYDAIGSTAGLDQLSAGSIDLAATDIPPQAPEPGILRVPTVIGGVVPIYNLPGFGRDLHLSGPVLAAIYSGKITQWNALPIRELNKGAHLPNAKIEVIHRTDGSGTTFVWTSYLAAASPQLASTDLKITPGPTTVWPVGQGAAGNEGVAELVQKTPYSLGYTELTYAIQHQLEYAAVRNSSGSFIKADLPSLSAAAASARSTGRLAQGSLLNTPASDAYPIATFTWLLVPEAKEDAQHRAALASLLRWMLTTGQKQCSALAYAPLPRDVANEELRQLDAQK